MIGADKEALLLARQPHRARHQLSGKIFIGMGAAAVVAVATVLSYFGYI